jgi:hypothetical protein
MVEKLDGKRRNFMSLRFNITYIETQNQVGSEANFPEKRRDGRRAGVGHPAFGGVDVGDF